MNTDPFFNITLLIVCVMGAIISWYKYSKGYGFRFDMGGPGTTAFTNPKWSHYGFWFAPKNKASQFSRIVLLLIAIFTTLGSMYFLSTLLSGEGVRL